MTLIVARHGQTPYNLEHRFYGSTDVALTSLGQTQAQTLARKLRPLAPTVIVHTGLLRTQQTAAPILAAFPDARELVQPGFAEKGFGQWEGLTADEIQAADPQTWQNWLAAPLTVTPTGAEAFSAFKQRVLAALATLKTDVAPATTVVLIAHLGTLRLIHQALVAPRASFWDLDFPAGTYTAYDWQSDQAQVIVRNG